MLILPVVDYFFYKAIISAKTGQDETTTEMAVYQKLLKNVTVKAHTKLSLQKKQNQKVWRIFNSRHQQSCQNKNSSIILYQTVYKKLP